LQPRLTYLQLPIPHPHESTVISTLFSFALRPIREGIIEEHPEKVLQPQRLGTLPRSDGVRPKLRHALVVGDLVCLSGDGHAEIEPDEVRLSRRGGVQDAEVEGVVLEAGDAEVL
jgi:hypothetical protein